MNFLIAITSVTNYSSLMKNEKFDTNPSIELANRVCYFLKNGMLPSEQADIIRTIKKLSTNPNKEIRNTVSKHFYNCDSIPKDIIKSMAYDIQEISCPILQHSPLIEKNDLIQIIKNTKDRNKLIAISLRADISDYTSELIINTNIAADIVIALLENKQAHLNDDIYKKILNVHTGNKKVVDTLIKRYIEHENYSISRLLDKLDPTIRNTLVQNYNIEVIKEDHKFTFKEHYPKDVENIDLMYKNGQLSENILIKYLCKGEIQAFAYCMSKIVQTPYNRIIARIMDIDISFLQFEEIYIKSSLPKHILPAIMILLGVIVEGIKEKEINENNFVKYVLNSLYTKNQHKKIPCLGYMIDMIKRNS